MPISDATECISLKSDGSFTELAMKATEALLAQKYLQVTHTSHKKPEGFPLPAKKRQPVDKTNLTQDYRPLAVLEYVHDILSAKVVANRFRAVAL